MDRRAGARLATVLLVVGGAAAAWVVSLPAPITPIDQRVSEVRFKRVNLPAGGEPRAPAFSPLGQYLAFQTVGDEGAARWWLSLVGRTGVADTVEVVPKDAAEDTRFELGFVWHPAPLLVGVGRVGELAPVLFRAQPRRAPVAVPLLDGERAPGPHAAPAISADGRKVAWIREGRAWQWDRSEEGPRQLGDDADVRRLSYAPDGAEILVEAGEIGGRRLLRRSLSGEADRVLSAADAGHGAWLPSGEAIWVERPAGGPTRVVREGPNGPREVIVGLRPSRSGGLGLSEDGAWVGWGVEDRLLRLTRLSDGRTYGLKTPCLGVDDVAIAQGFGQAWVSFTCSVDDGAETALVLGEITAVLNAPSGEAGD